MVILVWLLGFCFTASFTTIYYHEAQSIFFPRGFTERPSPTSPRKKREEPVMSCALGPKVGPIRVLQAPKYVLFVVYFSAPE